MRVRPRSRAAPSDGCAWCASILRMSASHTAAVRKSGTTSTYGSSCTSCTPGKSVAIPVQGEEARTRE